MRILKLALFFMLCIQVCGAQQQAEVDIIWQTSNDAYTSRDYAAAIEGYTQIMEQNGVSVELLYNLANAHYKNGELAKAILYYNRALKIDPTDSDTLHNLKNVAEQQTRDRIEEVPEFILYSWFRALSAKLQSNQWVVISLICFLLSGLFLLLFLLATPILYKKIGFYSLLATISLFGVTTRFSLEQRAMAIDSSQAIIMDNSLTVKSSPDGSATDLFILHEGTKVSVGNRLGSWIEVTIADGKRGWVREQSIEII